MGHVIRPSLTTSIGMILGGGVLALATGRLLSEFARETLEQGQSSFVLMLGVCALAGVACVGLGVRGVLRRDSLTIERRDQILLIPDGGSKRELPLAEIVSIQEVVGLSRTVQIKLTSGEEVTLRPELYGSAARLVAALERLRSEGL